MKYDGFVELHLHSHKSTLDGYATAGQIAAKAKEYNQKAIALTNHGNMVDWYEFYKACKKEDIKPILGNEVYFTEDRHVKEKGTKHYHMVLLAMNGEGLKNLFKLTTLSHIEGFYGKPRIDWELLEKYNEGLICTSACLASYPARLIADNDYLKAKKVIKKFHKTFGDRFYLELQPNKHAMQRKVNQAYVNWHKEMGIELIATTDAHYLDKADFVKHQTFVKIGGFDSKDTYSYNFMTRAEEVESLLVDLTDVPVITAKEAVANTVKVAERIEEYDIDTSTKLPHFEIPNKYKDEDEYLKQLCRDGWVRRGIHKLSKTIQKEYLDRLMVEFDVIFGKGFSGYFLIVQDFVNWARGKGIIVGYGRGSAGGSLVAWLTGIVELDPIQYGLLFERFLNPERTELPDIDVDFADRKAVYEYLIEKYGKDKVASVITFGTLGAKGVIRDVGKTMDIHAAVINQVAKLIPEIPGIKLAEAIEQEPELEEYKKKYPQWFEYAFAFEGKTRHFSTHASALVIADRPLTEVIPLMLDSKGQLQSMVDMKTCEELGLVKFDILGLKTLSVIQKTVDQINEGELQSA
ncbi:DNA polymerase III subunit alpha [Priestia megaterium]|uniref:DNA polymerase III subunit alpha n=1 Tax=Priestia megaterium TaxID=1404 RepID=UPI00203ACB27|nr:DNA polymerase III subunit alpha [Priestia megaterium]MCM3155567.1 DNA polymerase III subunit alpha [Priestia megaterium]